MTDFTTLMQVFREARRMERRIKDLARKSLRAGDRFTTSTIVAKTEADVGTVTRVVKAWLASPRLRLRERNE